MFSLPVFEHQLVMYVTADDKKTFQNPFDMSSIPIVTREQADAEDRTKKLTTATPTLKAPSTGPKKPTPSTAAEFGASAAANAQKYAQQFARIPEFQPYGAPLKSSDVIELTESETEYVVTAVKHIFKEHVVLQFDVKNTLSEAVLEDVSISASPSDEEEAGLEEEFIIPIAKLVTNEPGSAFVAYKRLKGEKSFSVTSFTNILKFTSKEIDPTTGDPEESGYEDEYEIEDLELTGSDYVVPAFVGSFSHVWEQVGAAGEESEETLQLSGVKSIAGRFFYRLDNLYAFTDRTLDATEQLTKTLSLQPLEGTDVPVNTSTHTLKLYGKTISGGRIVANVKMAYSAKTGVTTKISVRSDEEGMAALVIGSVG